MPIFSIGLAPVLFIWKIIGKWAQYERRYAQAGGSRDIQGGLNEQT
jgi:hypothetical protein